MGSLTPLPPIVGGLKPRGPPAAAAVGVVLRGAGDGERDPLLDLDDTTQSVSRETGS